MRKSRSSDFQCNCEVGQTGGRNTITNLPPYFDNFAEAAEHIQRVHGWQADHFHADQDYFERTRLADGTVVYFDRGGWSGDPHDYKKVVAHEYHGKLTRKKT